MIGLDTNVVLRLLLTDDSAQKTRVVKLVERAKTSGVKIFITLAVVLETEWVLRSSGKMTKPQVLSIFNLLLDSFDIEIDNAKVLEHAVHIYEAAAADFAECLFLAQYQHMGCSTMLTFDAKAARMDGVEMVEN
jgi:predicted nucleic-acid-binding protein